MHNNNRTEYLALRQQVENLLCIRDESKKTIK